MSTTKVPDGGAYPTAEHLRAQAAQLDPKTKTPLPTLGAGEQAKSSKSDEDENTENSGS